MVEDPERGNSSGQSALVAEADAAEIKETTVIEEMEQSYIDYAMSVIGGRALPDIRDGLKPVHRRILYSMYEEGISSSGSHRKSSSVVGKTMGDYHPHGDKSIYDTLVRLAQSFSLREPLVDGQGNFGSIDGDPPAAMRYTEARMGELAEQMVEELGEGVVDFSSNYDDRLEEPDVLPAKFPNLLVNGSSGIAVGMATNMVPHNLGEVIDATVHRIRNPECSVDELLDHINGPDFPTGAKILGRDGFTEAYRTGDGSVTVQADYTVETTSSGKDRIVVTEIPWQTQKSQLVEKIAKKANDELDGIQDLQDESDRTGIRIVIETRKSANTELIENKLRSSVLEKTISINNVVLVDGEPQRVTLEEILDSYIDHRRDVVQRRSESRLEEAEHDAHLLEGRLQALNEIETVVPTIRESETREEAKEGLESELGLTEEQSAHIVRMQLGSLTSLEEESLQTEYENTQERIDRLTRITEDQSELDEVIIEELGEIKDKYANERKTTVTDSYDEVSDEDLIPNEEVVVTLTDSGHIKRVSSDEFRIQNRRGKGVYAVDLQEGATPIGTTDALTHDTLVFLSDSNQLYGKKAYEVPESGRNTRGRPLQTLLKLDPDESIVAMANLGQQPFENTETQSLVFVTENGTVKRTALEEYDSSYLWSSGLKALSTTENDEVVGIATASENDTLTIQSANGKIIRFEVNECRCIGRTGKGVSGMKVESSDCVTDFAVVPSSTNGKLLVLSENGYGKQTPIEQYRTQSRGGKGYTNLRGIERNGRAVGIQLLPEGETTLRIQATCGRLISVESHDIPEVGRATKGSLIMETEENKTVVDSSLSQ